MRKTSLILCLGLFALLSCSQNPDNVETAIATVPAIQVSKIQQDTTPPKPKKKRSTVMTDPARPVSQINSEHPYDINLKDINGNIINTSTLLKNNGKPTVVLFWLTTCYPCRIEMKAIQKEVDQWKAETDFNIIAVSTDFEKNYERVVKMVNESNWSFESYWDMNREFRKVLPGALNGLPQSFIFDKDGKIAYHKKKYYTGDEHKLYEKVKELAAK